MCVCIVGGGEVLVIYDLEYGGRGEVLKNKQVSTKKGVYEGRF
jgi:hypothetical protein